LQILVYQDGLLTSSSLTVKQHSLYETTWSYTVDTLTLLHNAYT
jgi:hypothetical protein